MFTATLNGLSALSTNGHAPVPANGDAHLRATVPADTSQSVIIVGAGPVGLLVALRMAMLHVPVTILEQEAALNTSPRAAYYSRPAVVELKKAGLIDECREEGLMVGSVRWQTLDGRTITGLPNRDLGDDDRAVCIDQHRLGLIICKHLAVYGDNVKLLWNHKVTALSPDENAASVEVESPEGTKTFTANWVVGADGAASTVRKLLDLPFEGHTWEEPVVATNVVFPFEKYGMWDSNFIVDPEHWALIARVAKGGVWRCSYGEVPGLTREEYIARQPMKYDAMFPKGAPRPLQYDLQMISPYKLHQRCATTFRVGRVCLAGDAAHVCNPFGGMGLVGGLCDGGGLADCLEGILTGQASPSILDDYSRIRKQIWQDIINPVSSRNKVRLHTEDPEKIGENDPLLKEMCLAMAGDEQTQKTYLNAGLEAIMGIQFDFTTLWDTPKTV
ncbi:FAD/NADP-binding domain-containing protein [Dacryopinax primogenitus]|uniref:FAD/NADP-binding domain-containing protein n=1 Tax=Dacryopinax primogenitus (strain DJM 731) TaxID=1858805 RepID=M5FXB6_DACPD|nr:FAD/NADP-binding domain-containing protein [Dacryopinax primogenitus]EJU01099.1 FAD/NADP-binding domain-containing protein [Dacryopinax primogenitus]